MNVNDRSKLLPVIRVKKSFRIKLARPGNPPLGTGVRGILMYKSLQRYKDIVKRCPNHKNTSKDDHPYQDHVMRCENSSTIYDICPRTERLSLFIPLSGTNSYVCEEYFKELFKFMCFNSCVGGMNRQPASLLFRLECGGVSYGRAVVEIRICYCPQREITKKEKTTDVSTIASVLMSASNEPSSPPKPFQSSTFQRQTQTKKRKNSQYVLVNDGFVCKMLRKIGSADSTDEDLFVTVTRGQQRYKMLQMINEGLNLLKGPEPPEQHPHYRYATNCFDPAQEFLKIQTKTQSPEIMKENSDSTQSDVSPQSPQEQELSRLSCTSSNASSQSSTTTQHPLEFCAAVLTMKRSSVARQ